LNECLPKIPPDRPPFAKYRMAPYTALFQKDLLTHQRIIGQINLLPETKGGHSKEDAAYGAKDDDRTTIGESWRILHNVTLQ